MRTFILSQGETTEWFQTGKRYDLFYTLKYPDRGIVGLPAQTHWRHSNRGVNWFPLAACCPWGICGMPLAGELSWVLEVTCNCLLWLSAVLFPECIIAQ